DNALRLTHGDGTAVGELRRHLARLRPTGYAGLHAYIAPTPGRDQALAAIRRLLRDTTGRATTLGYGRRFLHSTGQLHKGGPPTWSAGPCAAETRSGPTAGPPRRRGRSRPRARTRHSPWRSSSPSSRSRAPSGSWSPPATLPRHRSRT